MSNPLASAEARQAAERIAEKILGWKCAPLENGDETQHLFFWVGEWVNEREASEMETNAYWFLVDSYAEKAALAESYADLARRADEIALELSQTIIAKDELFGEAESYLTRAEAAESLNRELVEALVEAAIPLEAIALAVDWELSPMVMTSVNAAVAKIRAAINSATPKQGEPDGQH